MGVYEKIVRINEITNEVSTINVTLKAVKYLIGTVNMETAERCLIISNNLGDRLEELANEYEAIIKDLGL